MPGFINDQNRIDGTRVTVWDVYLYSRKGQPRSRIAHDYRISEEEVQVALDYIDANLEYVERVHLQIEERNARGNSPEVRAILEANKSSVDAKWAEIRERIAAREKQLHDQRVAG